MLLLRGRLLFLIGLSGAFISLVYLYNRDSDRGVGMVL